MSFLTSSKLPEGCSDPYPHHWNIQTNHARIQKVLSEGVQLFLVDEGISPSLL